MLSRGNDNHCLLLPETPFIGVGFATTNCQEEGGRVAIAHAGSCQGWSREYSQHYGQKQCTTMVTFVKGSSLPVSINDRAACQLAAGGARAQLVVVEDIRQELIQPVWWGFSVAERGEGGRMYICGVRQNQNTKKQC